jgi:hypothetical protein
MNTREHQKKLRRKRPIKGKTKNMWAKKIRQKIWGRRRSLRQKDSRKQ